MTAATETAGTERTWTKVTVTGIAEVPVQIEILLPDGTDLDALDEAHFRIDANSPAVTLDQPWAEVLTADVTDSSSFTLHSCDVVGTGLDEMGFEIEDEED